MKIKDSFGRWHDVQLDSTLERSLWQSGKVHSGFYNPFEEEAERPERKSNDKGNDNKYRK